VQTVTVIDDTPPVIAQPSEITTNATMPSGAVVSFAPQATDNVGVVSLACAPPAGSVFPIGTTLVQCTAGDAAGNAAGAGFNVKVRGAPEQIVDLLELARGMTLPPRLKARLLAALQTALANPRNKPLACAALGAFIVLVREQPPSAIPPAKKAQMIADATRIKAVLGCP
ncbi:MAG: HYR domain-containing protein, partial [Pyrinomonadaceae bacterium]